MSDQSANAPTPELVEGASVASLFSPFEFDLDVAAKLGAKANGAEVIFIDAPANATGVPQRIPVLLRRGDNPGAENLAGLFDHWRVHPQRRTGSATAQTFDSFCTLVNRHKLDRSVVFADADWKKPAFVAVIDYHATDADGAPGFGKHRVRYDFPLSEEWKAWVEMDGKPMKQNEFAWFLEDRVAELCSPTDHEKVTLEHQFQTTIANPARVVELSRGLSVNVDTRVKATTVLSSGEGQIAWEETHNDGAGKPLKVPGLFMLQISPFFQGEKVRLPVRLRYRMQDGKVVWFYQMYRPDIVITEHVRERLFRVMEETGLPTYEGTPEMAA